MLYKLRFRLSFIASVHLDFLLQVTSLKTLCSCNRCSQCWWPKCAGGGSSRSQGHGKSISQWEIQVSYLWDLCYLCYLCLNWIPQHKKHFAPSTIPLVTLRLCCTFSIVMVHSMYIHSQGSLKPELDTLFRFIYSPSPHQSLMKLARGLDRSIHATTCYKYNIFLEWRRIKFNLEFCLSRDFSFQDFTGSLKTDPTLGNLPLSLLLR